MQNPFTFEAEPFQGYTELDELEVGEDEFDEESEDGSSWTPLLYSEDIYGSQSLVRELTDANYWNIFYARNKVVVVDFWQAWCRACDSVAQVMVDLAKRYKSGPYAGLVKFYHVRLDEDVNPKLSRTFGFPYVPVVYFYYTSTGRVPTRAAPLLEGSLAGEGASINLPKVSDPAAYVQRIESILRRHGHLKTASLSKPGTTIAQRPLATSVGEMELRRRPSGRTQPYDITGWR
jgi:thiol-disulfide isomerase/thioredoxin